MITTITSPAWQVVFGTNDASVEAEEYAVPNQPKPEDMMTTWEDLLARAASRCDTDPDSFVRGAWRAYFDARPEMKQHLEELHLRAQIEELRKEGRLALA